ncbi:MAG: TlpA family protein disulfide reductase [Flavobacterium sp.]|nr:TlpA family protein disulfide reductase [Flavobacterium sp.]
MKKTVVLAVIFMYTAFGFSQNNMVKFQANITNKNGESLFIKNNNIIVKELKGDKNGSFSGSFEVKEGMYQMFDGTEYADLYLKNGFDLKMTMDAKQFDETIKFSGVGSAENNFLATSTLIDSKLDYETVMKLDKELFEAKVDALTKENASRIAKEKLDPNFIALQKKSFDQNIFQLRVAHNQAVMAKKLNSSKAPQFDYVNVEGAKVKLESLLGKYVYIDVWATWCGPCRAEIPSLKKVEEKYEGKNIQFVSISVDVDKDLEKWKTFVKDKKLGGIQLFADKNWMSDFIQAFKINSIPRFLLIDPAGMVVDADAARPSDPKLVEKLDSLLK